MGLIACYECGNSISDLAATCPKCGAPSKASTFDANTVIDSAKNEPPKNETDRDEKLQATTDIPATELALARLKSELTEVHKKLRIKSLDDELLADSLYMTTFVLAILLFLPLLLACLGGQDSFVLMLTLGSLGVVLFAGKRAFSSGAAQRRKEAKTPTDPAQRKVERQGNRDRKMKLHLRRKEILREMVELQKLLRRVSSIGNTGSILGKSTMTPRMPDRQLKATASTIGIVAIGLGFASVVMPYFATVLLVPSAAICGIIAYRQGDKKRGGIALVLTLIGMIHIINVSNKIGEAQTEMKDSLRALERSQHEATRNLERAQQDLERDLRSLK